MIEVLKRPTQVPYILDIRFNLLIKIKILTLQFDYILTLKFTLNDNYFTFLHLS